MIYDLSKIIDIPLEYVTEGQPQSGNFVHTQVTSSRISTEKTLTDGGTDPFTGFFREDLHDTYEWIGISSFISSDRPCCWVLSYEDFYTSEQYDSRNIECGAGEGFQYKKADFSLPYRNVTYDKCRMLLKICRPTEKGMQIQVYYRVPAGYDGCVLGFHNSAALTQDQIKTGMSNPAASLGWIKRTDGDLYIRLK